MTAVTRSDGRFFGVDQQNSTQNNVAVDTVPVDIWLRVFLNLNHGDLYRLMLVNRFFKAIVDDDYIWRLFLAARYGAKALPDDGEENPKKCREVFEDKARQIASATTLKGPWIDDKRYWLIESSTESMFGKVAGLKRVWWLEVYTVIPAVAPGVYEIVWRIKLSRQYSGGFPLTFTTKAVTELGETNVPDPVSFPTNAWRTEHREPGWVKVVVPQRFVVDESHGCVDVKLGIENIDNSLKHGMSVDYVQLRDVDLPLPPLRDPEPSLPSPPSSPDDRTVAAVAANDRTVTVPLFTNFSGTFRRFHHGMFAGPPRRQPPPS